jgi:predicted ATPase
MEIIFNKDKFNKSQNDTIENIENLTNNRGNVLKNLVSKKKPCFYLYGNTGCGKTTVMNYFFTNATVSSKINMHFADYFIDISRLLTKYSVKELAKEISKMLITLQTGFCCLIFWVI